MLFMQFLLGGGVAVALVTALAHLRKYIHSRVGLGLTMLFVGGVTLFLLIQLGDSYPGIARGATIGAVLGSLFIVWVWDPMQAEKRQKNE